MPGPRARIDFAAIAAAALARAEDLVAKWLPAGKRVGHEWQCGSLTGEAGESCSVNLTSGAWADFATEEKGRDLISLYAAVYGLKAGKAARELAKELGLQTAPPTAHPPVGADNDDEKWIDAGAWPPDGVAPPKAHTYRGVPQRRWTYVDAQGAVLGHVCRFVTSDGGKEILPLVWSRHPKRGAAWKWRAFTEPRPLYGLDRLAANPLATVLVVEGEKCAEMAQEVLGSAYTVTTWPAGSKATAKARWEVLAGRRVILWPDCDAKRKRDGGGVLPEWKQPGLAAMEAIAQRLVPLGCDVSIVQVPAPGDRPDGWDVADLIEQTGEEALQAVSQWLQSDRLRRPRPQLHVVPGGTTTDDVGMPQNRNGAARPGGGEGGDGGGEPPGHRWQDDFIWTNRELAKHAANVALILQHDQRWKGVIAYDEFAQRTVKRAPPPYDHSRAGEWTDDDDTRASVWLAQRYRLQVSSQTVGEAISMVAREAMFHPVREWLYSLRWDGQERLPMWLVDCAGVEASPYIALVSKYFLIGMVRRVMQPGCKFDYCLVLEGQEGLRKSSLAAALGGHWASDSPLDLTHKDSMAGLQGKWVHEFSEMEAVTRAEAHLQKSFLSRQVDEFRPVYGRRHIRCPRQCVFIGTTNEDEYIKEGQGARRFWPVAVPGEIDIDGLRANLEQLLAEAVHRYDAGERCYPTPDEQRELFSPEQRKRVVQESLIDALHDWVLHPLADEYARRLNNGGAFSLADAAYYALKITYAQLTRDLQTRVGKALTALGCTKVEKRNGMTRYWYKPPKNAAKSPIPRDSGQPAQPPQEAGDAPPF